MRRQSGWTGSARYVGKPGSYSRGRVYRITRLSPTVLFTTNKVDVVGGSGNAEMRTLGEWVILVSPPPKLKFSLW